MTIQYREALASDVAAMAAIRSDESGKQEYWEDRIEGYMNARLHPQEALPARMLYLAVENDTILGFAAGHLTRRFACEGELQWINIIPAYRRTSIADELLRMMAKWFIAQNAAHVCVNADMSNPTSQRFYKRNGAEDLSLHWMVWKDISVILENKS